MSDDLASIIDGQQTPAPEVQETPATPEVTAEAAEEPKPEDVTPKEEAPKVEEPKAEEPAMVPISVVAGLRQELRDLKATLTQKAPTPPPDVLDDPQGFAGHIGQQVQMAQVNTKLELSRFLAEEQFGADEVEAARAFFDDRPELSHALLSHPSPFHAAVAEYKKHVVAQEIGSDPAAYADRLRQQIAAEVKAELVTEQAKERAAQTAPSLANVTGTGGGPKTTWAGPTSLESLIG